MRVVAHTPAYEPPQDGQTPTHYVSFNLGYVIAASLWAASATCAVRRSISIILSRRSPLQGYP